MLTFDDTITARDYFMANAPAEPQAWFLPEMPPCPVVPSVNAVQDDEFRAELKSMIDSESDDMPQRAQDWFNARDEAAKAQSDWQAEFWKQRCIQWPAAWADTQLEQRKC